MKGRFFLSDGSYVIYWIKILEMKKPSIKIGQKGDVSDFECDIVVGVRGAVLSISEQNADIL